MLHITVGLSIFSSRFASIVTEMHQPLLVPNLTFFLLSSASIFCLHVEKTNSPLQSWCQVFIFINGLGLVILDLIGSCTYLGTDVRSRNDGRICSKIVNRSNRMKIMN